MDDVFFNDWATLLRTLVVGVLAYAVLIIFLRIAGKRTLSKMNAFDFVVTVALGSTLATILLNKDVALAEGTLAFALLIGLQFIVTWTGVRAGWVRSMVTGEPTLLFYHGEFLEQGMQRERVVESEILAAMRANGLSDPAEAGAVVLETDGSLSVVRKDTSSPSAASLRGVEVPFAGHAGSEKRPER